MAIVARGSLEKGHSLVNTERTKAYTVTWTGRAGSLILVAVNLSSSLSFHRDPGLQALCEGMQRVQPDIVVGDFNAPRRSRALEPLPKGFRHAYDCAGSGWSYTWPVPCPVYAIDQCIVGSRVRPIRYFLVSTLRSDHRAQVMDFAVPETTK